MLHRIAPLWAVLTAALILCAAPASGQPAPASAPTLPAQRDVSAMPEYAYWPHEAGDIAPDPTVRYGVLPNGMRYALLQNKTPKGVAAARLRIAAGSLQEDEDQRGLAHFLEHMAFNGSQNVPEGEMVKTLERLGLSFGADTNASTGLTQTTYSLDLPQTDDERIDTALFLFREIADKLSLDPAAIDRERGVVLAEARARTTPASQLSDAVGLARFPGSRMIARTPIGLQAVVERAPPEALRRYYHTYYRPERALLVLVGDFDVAAVEAKIRARFSDWRGAAPDQPDPGFGPRAAELLETAGFFEPSLPQSFSAQWQGPPRPTPTTRAEFGANVTRGLAYAILARRFADRARQPDAMFLNAAVGQFNTPDFVGGLTLAVTPKEGKLLPAVQEAQAMLRQALEHGFLDAELERVRKDTREGLKNAITAEPSRNTYGAAGGLLGAFAGRAVFVSATQSAELVEPVLAAATPTALQAALRETLPQGAPQLFLSGPKEPEGGLAPLLEAWRSGWAAPVAPYAEAASEPFPYTDFGPPGRVAARGRVKDLNIYTYRFANGVRLNVKPSTVLKGNVSVEVGIGGGLLASPPLPGWSALVAAVYGEGGLGRMDVTALNRALSGISVQARSGVGAETFVLLGATTPEHFQLQMRLLAAFVTDPGFRTTAVERMKDTLRRSRLREEGAPGGVLGRELAAILRSGDPRWAAPSLEQIEALDPALPAQVLRPALANHPIEIAVVGDIEPERVAQEVAATFGALPRRGAWTAPQKDRRIALPPPGSRFDLTHKFAADQTSVVLAWPAPDASNARLARTAELLADLMGARLVDEVRERQGAAYSPSATAFNTLSFPGYGYILVNAQLKPDQIGAFEAAVTEITRALASGAIEPDALERVRKPAVEQARNAQQSNSYWVSVLSDLQTRPDRLARVRSRVRDLETISAQEIAALAAEAFAKPAIRIEAAPAPAAAAAQ